MIDVFVGVNLQNDFLQGTNISSAVENREYNEYEAAFENEKLINKIKKHVEALRTQGTEIVWIQNTYINKKMYLQTRESKRNQTPYTIKDTEGWKIKEGLVLPQDTVLTTSGTGAAFLCMYLEDWASQKNRELKTIEFAGLYSDTNVITNVVLTHENLRNVEIVVDSGLCRGTTNLTHVAAINIMKSLQVTIIDRGYE